jgi:hypothetical protein
MFSIKILGSMTALVSLALTVYAQQPPIWSAKPDVVAFEAIENNRLASANTPSTRSSPLRA